MSQLDFLEIRQVPCQYAVDFSYSSAYKTNLGYDLCIKFLQKQRHTLITCFTFLAFQRVARGRKSDWCGKRTTRLAWMPCPLSHRWQNWSSASTNYHTKKKIKTTKQLLTFKTPKSDSTFWSSKTNLSFLRYSLRFSSPHSPTIPFSPTRWNRFEMLQRSLRVSIACLLDRCMDGWHTIKCSLTEWIKFFGFAGLFGAYRPSYSRFGFQLLGEHCGV